MEIAFALVWEFWARGWRGILMAWAGGIAFLFLIYGAVWLEGGVTYSATQAGRAMQVGFYWVVLIFIGSSVLIALGNPVRRYTLPASSLMLVGWPMACGMATTFVLYASTAAIMNATFDAYWSIVGPGLLAAILAAWFQAILWSTSNWLVLQFLACLGSFGVALFTFERMPGDLIYNVSAVQPLLFGPATIVCLAIGTLGFANLRGGAGVELEQLVSRLNWRRWRAGRSASFQSPASAQFWLEFVDRGYALPVGTAMIGIAVLGIALFWRPPDPRAFVLGTSGFLAPLAIMTGVFLGLRSQHGEFGNFNGSRPLTDSQIAKAVLQSVTFGLLASTVIWAGALTGIVLILGWRDASAPSFQAIWQLDRVVLVGRFVIGAMLVWSAVGLLTSASLAGKKVLAATYFPPFGLTLVGIVVPKYFFVGQARATFSQWYSYACLGLFVLLALAIYAASVRLRLISWKTLLLTASIIALTIVAGEKFHAFETSLPLAVLCGCCFLPVPLAAAPLAVWFNRHR